MANLGPLLYKKAGLDTSYGSGRDVDSAVLRQSKSALSRYMGQLQCVHRRSQSNCAPLEHIGHSRPLFPRSVSAKLVMLAFKEAQSVLFQEAV